MASASLDWERHKEAMRALYVDEDKPLKDVMDIMKGPPYHFSATKKQYERQFQTKWRFRKNLSKQDWKILHFKVSKRQSIGKRTKVFVRDRLLQVEKMEHEISRYGLNKLVAFQYEPKTPDGISIRSPTPTSPVIPSVEIGQATRLMGELGNTAFDSIAVETVDLTGPEVIFTRSHTDGLPYFELLKLFASRFQAAHSQLALLNPASLTSFLMLPQERVWSGKEGSSEVVASKRTSLLREVLPPRADGLILIGNASGHTKDPQVQFLTNSAYLLYNGLGSPELSAFIVDFFSVPENQRAMEPLMSSMDIAIKAFTEKLILSLIEMGNDHAAVQVLEQGHVTPHPLQLVEATRKGCQQTVKLLLERGVNPNWRLFTPNSHYLHGQTALEIAVLSKNNLLAEQLVEYGADPNNVASTWHPGRSAFICAIDTANLGLLDYFLHSPTCQNSNNFVSSSCKALWLLIAADKGDTDQVSMLLPHVSVDHHNYRGNSALSAAALRGRHNVVSLLLRSGASPNRSRVPMYHMTGPSPLQAAIAAIAKGFVDREDLDTIRLLIECGADVNEPPGDSDTAEWSELPVSRRTAIQAAAEIDHEELFFYLLSKGANPYAPAAVFDGLSASDAALGSQSQAIRNFFSFTCPDTPPFSRPRTTSLIEAVSAQDFPAVRKILESGCDVNETGFSDGVCTALSVAIMKNDTALVQLLLDSGADINHPETKKKGGTALQAAIRMKNVDLVESLISRGADVSDDEALAIATAASPSRITTEIFSAIEEQLTCRPRRWIEGQLAMNAAIRKGDESTVLKLIQFGVDHTDPAYFFAHHPNEPSDFRDEFQRWFSSGYFDGDFVQCENSLATAIRLQKQKIVEILLEHGICICSYLSGWIRCTPLEYAAKHGNSATVQLLLDMGASCNGPHIGTSTRTQTERLSAALECAARGGYIGIARILLDHGANPNFRIKYAATALETAAEHGRLDMLQLLLDAGADMGGPKSAYFRGVLCLAYQGGHMTVIDFLKAQRVKVRGPRLFHGNLAEEISIHAERCKVGYGYSQSYQDCFGHDC